MDVIARKIVSHTYSEESLFKVYSPNEIKSENFEWNEDENKKHPLSNEIKQHDIVYSIQSIDNPKDEYGFCIIDVEQLPEKNYKYDVKTVLLDINLPEFIITAFCESVTEFLCQKNRASLEDTFRVDRIIEGDILPLSATHLDSTKKQFVTKVLNLFKSSKNGIAPISTEMEKRLKEIAETMNAPE